MTNDTEPGSMVIWLQASGEPENGGAYTEPYNAELYAKAREQDARVAALDVERVRLEHIRIEQDALLRECGDALRAYGDPDGLGLWHETRCASRGEPTHHWCRARCRQSRTVLAKIEAQR